MKDTIIGALVAYFLMATFAPMLGFTAVLDFGYLLTGQPMWALFHVLVTGPLCMFGLFLLTKDK